MVGSHRPTYFMKVPHILLTPPYPTPPPPSHPFFKFCSITHFLDREIMIILWSCNCRGLASKFQNCFIQQGVKFTEGFTRMTSVLLEIWFDINHKLGESGADLELIWGWYADFGDI